MKRLASLLVTMLVGACTGASPSTTQAGGPSTIPPPGTGPAVHVAPEFVQGTIPGATLMLLVALEDDSGPVEISVRAEGAEVGVDPATIGPDEVAEVTIVPGPTEVEAEVSVTIEAQGEAGTTRVVRTVTVMPWSDDRAEQAGQILGLFTSRLAQERADLGIADEVPAVGSFTAPMLLVVSHYTWWSEDWEIGLAWHVMVPPDDFAEVYLRPRDSLAPTHAFRIESWQSALATGQYEVTEVAAPPEVVR